MANNFDSPWGTVITWDDTGKQTETGLTRAQFDAQNAPTTTPTSTQVTAPKYYDLDMKMFGATPAQAYANASPDLVTAWQSGNLGTDFDAAMKNHYEQYGRSEGRQNWYDPYPTISQSGLGFGPTSDTSFSGVKTSPSPYAHLNIFTQPDPNNPGNSGRNPGFGAFVGGESIPTPPAPSQPVINNNGSMGTGGPLSTLPGAPTPNTINAFNTDPDTPHSGMNWRQTAIGDRSNEDFYGIFKDGWENGKTPSQIAQERGWGPGDVSAYEDYVRQWAEENGKPFYGLRSTPKKYSDYYTYGYGAVPDSTKVGRVLPKYDPATGDPTGEYEDYTMTNPIGHYLDMWGVKKATGGQIKGGLGAIKSDPVIKGYIKGGKTGGQEDDVPALLSNNEYVMDADVVAALGDGNPDAGAAKLDKMRENIRRHKRKAPAHKIPPKAKKAEQYLKGK